MNAAGELLCGQVITGIPVIPVILRGRVLAVGKFPSPSVSDHAFRTNS